MFTSSSYNSINANDVIKNAVAYMCAKTFGDFMLDCQTAKLNVSPIYLRLRYDGDHAAFSNTDKAP